MPARVATFPVEARKPGGRPTAYSRVCPNCGARYSRAWKHLWCWHCHKEYAPAGSIPTGAGESGA